MTQTKEKLKGKFYPLTPEYSQILRKANLTAAEWRIWSYLIEIDPWGDKYHDIKTFTIISECDCSKATFYRAIAKFQELGLFDFQDKGISFKNEIGTERLRKGYLKNETKILKNETEFSEMRQDSQICENETPKTLPDKDSGSPQTVQNFQTPQTGGGENIFSNNSDVLNNEESSSGLTDLGSILNNTSVVQNQIEKEVRPDGTLSPVRNAHLEDNCSAACNTTKVEQLTPSKPECIQKEKLTIKNLTPELQAKLEDLNIPLDQAVKKAIASYHSSQIWGALAHVEECSNEIRSPRGVFLYQIPRQEIDRRKPREFFFTPELNAPHLNQRLYLIKIKITTTTIAWLKSCVFVTIYKQCK